MLDGTRWLVALAVVEFVFLLYTRSLVAREVEVVVLPPVVVGLPGVRPATVLSPAVVAGLPVDRWGTSLLNPVRGFVPRDATDLPGP